MTYGRNYITDFFSGGLDIIHNSQNAGQVYINFSHYLHSIGYPQPIIEGNGKPPSIVHH